jgi:hypothetical protein
MAVVSMHKVKHSSREVHDLDMAKDETIIQGGNTRECNRI